MVDKTTKGRTRRKRSVDVGSFAHEIEAALTVFTVDVSYAVSMARAAVTIETKRQSWLARKELRAAEAAAHAECAQHVFECHAESPCGTGDCKFAQGEMALIRTGVTSGCTSRPQTSNCGPYALDAAVPALLAQRSSRT